MSDLPESYGVLYQFAHEFDKDAKDSENAAIRILEPKYKGIVIRFNHVSFVENAAQDNFVMKYNYDIISGKVPKADKKDFDTLVGDLLYDLMLVKCNME